MGDEDVARKLAEVLASQHRSAIALTAEHQANHLDVLAFATCGRAAGEGRAVASRCLGGSSDRCKSARERNPSELEMGIGFDSNAELGRGLGGRTNQ